METTQIKLLKHLQEKSRLSSTKENTRDELDTIQKLEAFDMIEKNRKHSYKPTSRFYKYAQRIIDSQTPVEEFNFQESKKIVSNNVFNNTIQGNVLQLNQGDGNYSIGQINIEIIKNALEKLEPHQKEELNEALNKKDNKVIFETLKSFGNDLLSNVLASIINNPSLFT